VQREQIELQVLASKIQEVCKVVLVDVNEERSYEENLVAALEKLQIQKDVDDKFASRVLEKESMRPSITSDGLAYPHAKNELETKILLLIAKNTPFNLSSEAKIDVQDIILLAVPDELADEEQDILIKIYDTIFDTNSALGVYERLGLNFTKINQFSEPL
jgi:mannitol/fructose-specific phosphotransferase system IIA component (Ntr-type)